MRALLLLIFSALTFGISAQITANGNSGVTTTNYTTGAPNNNIFIWCGNTIGSAQGSLTATPTTGTGPFTFNWFFHNQGSSSWQALTTQTGATSTLTGLASDGYRVEIRDAGNNLVNCFIAWVWNLNTQVTASNTRTGCNTANLTSTVNTTGSFSYYNPPPPESIITGTTSVQVCFTATHTYVSDLAFYLIGPPSCGSPVILLSPNPGAIGEGAVCNSGDNLNNLCFGTAGGNLSICAPAPVPLTGNYSSYGAGGTPINWNPLIGCNAASGGWTVQIYDCIGADVGALTNANLTFSNLNSLCGSPTTIAYNSGAINSIINDNSCTAATASTFSVPPPAGLTTPITLNATTTLQWTATPATAITGSTNANATSTPGPGTTTYTQTATTTFGGTTCTSSATTAFTYALPVVSAGPPQTVCNGGTVTLSGSGASTYTWNNGVTNNVAFTPPPGTTTYTVTGTDAAGCQATASTTVTVSATPVINVNSGTICPGGSIVLNATGASTYTWSPATGLSATTGSSVTASPAATTTYTITGTNAAGCVGSTTATVTIGPNPVITVNSATICNGSSVVLNATGGATSYSWSPATGLSATTGSSVTASPPATTTYTITGTTGGCTSTTTATVTVNAVPVVTVNSGAICAGGSIVLNATGATTYTWSPAGGLSATTGATVTANPGTTNVYTVTGTTSGCSSTANATVTVNPNPAVTAAPATICAGSSATLTANGAATYTWSPATGLSATTGTSVTASPAATTTYTITGTSAAGCTGTGTVTVTVNPIPVVTATPATICNGSSATITASGAATYAWSPATGLSSTTGNPVTANPSATTTYTITGTSLGCSGTGTVTVTVNPVPVIAVNSGAVCTGGSLVLNATGGTTYAWSPATGLSATTGATVTSTPAATTVYTVTGTSLGCSGTATATVTVNPTPTVTVPSQTICAGSSTTLTASGAATYTWSPATGLSATTGSSVTANPATTTTYTITGTSAAGCPATTTATVTVNPIPVVNVPPATICAGASTVLTASGATTYTWSPATGLSATTGNPVTASPAATTIYIVNGTTNGCTGSTTVTVTVNPNPTMTAPNSQTICAGTPLAAEVLTSNPAGSTFAWTNSNTAIGLAASGTSNIPGFTATNAGSTQISGTITITPTLNGCVGAPVNYTITVNPIPVISPVASISQCTGTTVAASNFNVIPASTVTWTNSNTDIGLAGSGTVNTPAFTATNTTLGDISGTITVNATAAGCPALPVTYTITVNQSPVMTDPADISQCAGTTVAASNFQSNIAGTVFTWTNSNTGIGAPASGTGDYSSFTALNPGSTDLVGTFTVTPSLGLCPGPDQTFTITVRPIPVADPVANVTECAEVTTAAITLSGTVTPTTYSWTNDNTSIGLAASGTNTVPSFTTVNTGNTPQTATVTISPEAAGCTGASISYTITINPIPVITPVNDVTECTGTAIPAIPFVISTPSTVTWTNSNTDVGLAASGNTQTPAFTTTNTTLTTISGTVTVNATAAGCNADPETFIISVPPVPVMIMPTDVVVCAGTVVGQSNFQSSPAGSTYAWTNDQSSIGLASAGTGNFQPFTSVNNGTLPVVATVTVTPTLGQCTGNPDTYTITVNPIPVANASNTGPYCLMDDAQFSAAPFPSATYSWTGPNNFSSTLQNPTITDLVQANDGTYNLTVTANGCSASTATVLTISPGIPVTITPAGPFCANEVGQIMAVNSTGGTWSGTGITNAATGLFDPAAAAIGDNTITYTPPVGCMIASSIPVTVNIMPDVNFSANDTLGCAAHTVQFTDLSTPQNGDLTWTFGDGGSSTANGTVSHTYGTAGTYSVTLTSTTDGCSTSETFSNYITVTPQAIASFSIIDAEQTTTNPFFEFSNSSVDATTYVWNFGDSTSSSVANPDHLYAEEAGNYTVTLYANNPGNCPDTTTRVVIVKEELIFYVPNAFTPDGDAYNNVFEPVFHSGFDPFSYTLLIFDRWGEILFESHDVSTGWDGTYGGQLVKEGVYTWKIDFKDFGSDDKFEYVGSVVLLK